MWFSPLCRPGLRSAPSGIGRTKVYQLMGSNGYSWGNLCSRAWCLTYEHLSSCCKQHGVGTACPGTHLPMVRREMNRKVMETAMGRAVGARYQVPGTSLGSQVPSMVRSRCSLVGANPCRTPHLLPFAHMAIVREPRSQFLEKARHYCRETLHNLGRRNILIARGQPPHRFP